MKTVSLVPLAFRRLAGRLLPDLAQPPMRRLEHAVIDAVERRRRMGKLAQHELHDLAGLAGCATMKPTIRSSVVDSCARAASGPGDTAADVLAEAPSAWLGDDLDGLDDMVGGGDAQPFLAAEMIGDRADIGLGRGRDLARRRAVEALAAEQDERCPDQGFARGRDSGRRWGRFVRPGHARILFNRMIKVNKCTSTPA